MVQKKTLMQRRKTDRERQKRFRERLEADGKKAVTAILRPEAQARLEKERKITGETYSQIIERAILGLKPKLIKRKK